jgi:hypothetical protein
MKTVSMIRTAAWLNLTGAIGILAWWFMMPLFLPVADAANNFQQLILDSEWIPVNMAGLVSTMLITLGFPGFYFAQREKSSKLGFTGLVVASTGLILFTSIQYYETLLWPAAAETNPALVMVHGALVSGNKGVAGGLVVAGMLLGAGYILFGISALQSKVLPRIPIWMLITGAPVFGNGMVFPVRTIGLLLFASGTSWLAITLIKLSPSELEDSTA